MLGPVPDPAKPGLDQGEHRLQVGAGQVHAGHRCLYWSLQPWRRFCAFHQGNKRFEVRVNQVLVQQFDGIAANALLRTAVMQVGAVEHCAGV